MAGQICIMTTTGVKCLDSPMHGCTFKEGSSWARVTKEIDVTAAVKTLGVQGTSASVIQNVLELLLQSEAELHGPFTIVKT
ncbi:MAG: hypothetical protein Q8Q85_07250 [Gemmatimonadales bacterium]|nr:hypothetical protein [Gemmatimonadales bacterium]